MHSKKWDQKQEEQACVEDGVAEEFDAATLAIIHEEIVVADTLNTYDKELVTTDTLVTNTEEIDTTVTLAVIKKYVVKRTDVKTQAVKTAETTPLKPGPSTPSTRGLLPARPGPTTSVPSTTRSTLWRELLRRPRPWRLLRQRHWREVWVRHQHEDPHHQDPRRIRQVLQEVHCGEDCWEGPGCEDYWDDAIDAK
jgi:hypothetical protein